MPREHDRTTQATRYGHQPELPAQEARRNRQRSGDRPTPEHRRHRRESANPDDLSPVVEDDGSDDDRR